MPRKDPSFDSYLDQQIDEHMADPPACPDCADSADSEAEIKLLNEIIAEQVLEVDSLKSGDALKDMTHCALMHREERDDLQKEVDTLQEELDTFRQTKWWSALEEQGNINKDLQDTITGLKTMFEELQGRFDRQAEVLESYAEERMRLEKELEKAAVIIAQLLTKP